MQPLSLLFSIFFQNFSLRLPAPTSQQPSLWWVAFVKLGALFGGAVLGVTGLFTMILLY